MGDLIFKVPLGTYAGQLKELAVQTLTQKRFANAATKGSGWLIC